MVSQAKLNEFIKTSYNKDLYLAYSPGVAAPVKEISKNPELAYITLVRKFSCGHK